jgi:hypothetical protein
MNKNKYTIIDELQKRIVKKLEDIPKIYRGIYIQAIEKMSRKAAIHAFCLECCAWQKEEIRKCTSPECPLFALRPYQNLLNMGKP